jgi:alkaline phosphatase D
VVTCQGHETVDDPVHGHWVYSHMLTHDPDFFVHTGDVVYYDKGDAMPFSKTVAMARQRWNRMFAYTWNRDFHSQVSSYFMKDDHDTLKNDCWPGQSYGEITWEEGLALFKEQTPQGKLPYRNFRWGKDLEIWLMEGRDYRSPNNMDDGPEKTILGKEQKAWLKKTLQASDATFKLAVFPSPIVGPDKRGKNDNHSNPGFTHEGDELRTFLSSIPNTFVVCGDRHCSTPPSTQEPDWSKFAPAPSTMNTQKGAETPRRTKISTSIMEAARGDICTSKLLAIMVDPKFHSSGTGTSPRMGPLTTS